MIRTAVSASPSASTTMIGRIRPPCTMINWAMAGSARTEAPRLSVILTMQTIWSHRQRCMPWPMRWSVVADRARVPWPRNVMCSTASEEHGGWVSSRLHEPNLPKMVVSRMVSPSHEDFGPRHEEEQCLLDAAASMTSL